MSPLAPPTGFGSANRPRRTWRDFWQQVTEGRQIDELWSQFSSDARASYGFYGKDVDWDEINQASKWQRPFRIAKQIFLALLMKLTAARRVLLLLALALLLLASIHIQSGDQSIDIRFDFLAALMLLVLLALELADKVTMKRDLEIAREIQSWLVPSQPPVVPNADIAFATRPQNSVAGDYYDAFYPIGDAASGGRLCVVIADVAGKSVPAALLMATFQASLRTITSEGVALADVVKRLNQYACQHSLQGQRFTTAVIGEYEIATRRLTYANAGHNPPLLRRADGTLERLESGGVPLGIMEEATHELSSVTLHSGDALVLYTDGCIEAFNEKGEEFGEARWEQAVRNLPNVPAMQSMMYLMHQVDQFVGTTRQADDITCLVFRSI